MTTRTITQTKVFSIIAPGQDCSGHGYTDYTPSITYAKDVPWESEEHCAQMLEDANRKWEEQSRRNPWGTTHYRPKLQIYWITT